MRPLHLDKIHSISNEQVGLDKMPEPVMAIPEPVMAMPEPVVEMPEPAMEMPEPMMEGRRASMETEEPEHLQREHERPQPERERPQPERERPVAKPAVKDESSAKSDVTSQGIEKDIQKAQENAPKKYIFPSLKLLKPGMNKGSGDSAMQLKQTAMHLQKTLATFGVKVTVTDISQDHGNDMNCGRSRE